MCRVTVVILIRTNKFITVKVFLRLLTISTRFQNIAFFGHPNGGHFLNRTIDVSGITIIVLVGTNEFITVKVFLRLLTIGTRFQHIAFLSHPNRSHFLDWFFNRAIDMSSITVFVLVGTNKFITVKVFLRLFTISTRFQNFAFFSYPNRSHFLDWFFNRAIDMSSITVFVLVGTNKFITVKVFLRLFTISTRFQNFAFFSYPNRSHFLDWFFNLTIDVGDGLSTFNNLSWVYLVLFHEGVIIVFEVNSGWVFQFDGFIDRFHPSISRSLDFFARFVHEFLDNISFHNRFFNLSIDVSNDLSTFDNLGWVNLVLFHEGIVIVLKVNSGWVFQLDGFIDWFNACICRGFDFFTSFVHEFLDNVSFHYRFFDRFFYFFVDVGDGLSSFNNLGWVNLVLFDEGVIVVFEVDSHWVFQFDSFINRFYTCICRGFDFFTSFVHEFLDNVTFHNRFFNLFVNVGDGLSTFDNLRRVNLVLSYEGIIVVFKVNGCWVFQLDGFIDWFNACISRGFDFFARFVHEFLDNVSFHHWFFNLTIDVGDGLSPLNNLRRVHLVLSHEGIIIVFEVNGSWVFQFDSFIDWFHTCICRGFDFFACFVDEFLNHISFWLHFLIEVGNGFTESIWDFSRIHPVLTGEFVGFSFKLNRFRMRQAECFTNRSHTSIRLWSQFLVSSFFLEQLANRTFRIR